MTRHYLELGSASDWSSRVENLLQPIRGTTSTQISLVTRHQYEIEFLRLFLRRHFAGKPVLASQNDSCFLKTAN